MKGPWTPDVPQRGQETGEKTRLLRQYSEELLQQVRELLLALPQLHYTEEALNDIENFTRGWTGLGEVQAYATFMWGNGGAAGLGLANLFQ